MTIGEDRTGESWHGNQDSTYKKTYSLADIARILKKPRTTIQSWRDQFKPYLPTVPGTKGRTLRYQRESLELFKLIAHLKDAQEPPDVIENVLKGTVNYIVIDEETTKDAIMNKPILEMM
ncbi:MerR family transcriptional regulator, partial [Escherichia sp. SP-MK2]